MAIDITGEDILSLLNIWINNMNFVNIDQCKLLKDKGYPQDASFYWVHSISGSEDIVVSRESAVAYKPIIAAPMTDELLEKIPAMVTVEDVNYYLIIEKFPHSNHFELNYVTEEDTTLHWGANRQKGKTLVEACARMWLYLKENNLL